MTFVSQHTLTTQSDHRALIVVVKVNGIRLRLATWNFGPGTARDLELLLMCVGGYGVVALQECGDRAEIIAEVAGRRGFTIVQGDGRRGQKSTVLLAGPYVGVRSSLWRLILDRMYIGRGAGPDYNKPKWWLGGKLDVKGVRFGASSVHVVPSQQFAVRQAAALRQVARIARITARRGLWFNMGDYNATSSSRTIRFLYRLGFTDNHREGGIVATHGHRDIDRVMWRTR